MSNGLTIPSNIEVIENGKPITRIDPNVASFIMAAAQTAQLVKLRKLEESKIPIGSKSFSWTITTTLLSFIPDNPWISFSLINDGPNNLYLKVNIIHGGVVREAPVLPTENYSIDFEYPIIDKIYFSTSTGTAAIRIWGEEGKWA